MPGLLIGILFLVSIPAVSSRPSSLPTAGSSRRPNLAFAPTLLANPRVGWAPACVSASRKAALRSGRRMPASLRMMNQADVMPRVDRSAAREASQYKGFHHIHMWVGNAMQTATFFISRMGFEPVAYSGLETGSRDVATHVVRQGGVTFAFSSPLNPHNDVMGSHQAKHGDAVKDVALLVKDCEVVFADAVKRGARVVRAPEVISDKHGSVKMAAIETYGDTIHSFVEVQDYEGPFLPGFVAVAGEYMCTLGFERFWSVDDKQVVTKYSSLRSVVMTDPGALVKMPINEPAVGIRKSQIQEYIDYNGGPGVQHIALRTFDILHTVTMMRQRGLKFLKVPDTYYMDLRKRLSQSSVKIDECLDRIQELNLLVDFDEEGYLLQTFMRPIQDRPTLFLEIIQRANHEGFGVGNFKALFEAIEREQQLRGNL